MEENENDKSLEINDEKSVSEFTKLCLRCGSNFEYLSENKKYCSAKCANALRIINTKNKYIESLKQGIVFGRTINEHFYLKYKKSAQKRGVEFMLSLTEFNLFMKYNCHYCNSEINTVGIDRMNNDMGYVLENCVPCCTECNLMKRGMLYQSFINQCNRISEWKKI